MVDKSATSFDKTKTKTNVIYLFSYYVVGVILFSNNFIQINNKMKAFVIAALIAASNARSLERLGSAAAADYTLMGPPSPWTWTVNVQTVVDEDTGGQWVQFLHTLIADIKSTEEVTFEMSFSSVNNPAVNVKERMAEDSGKCIISLSSTCQDCRFWT